MVCLPGVFAPHVDESENPCVLVRIHDLPCPGAASAFFVGSLVLVEVFLTFASDSITIGEHPASGLALSIFSPPSRR
jgi:hypothetical protein